MEQKFSLNHENMKNLPFDKYANDFTFYVNGKPYTTSRVVADILSPPIRNMHYLDSAINEFTLEVSSDSKDEVTTDYFEDFLHLATFDNSIIDQTKQKYYLEYFYKLGNIDAYFQLQPTYVETLSVDNIIDRLIEMSKFIIKTEKETISSPKILDQLIQFASCNFEEIDKEKLKKLPLCMIENIINNESLVLYDEDSLLVFILSLYKNDCFASNLFEYVLFKNVSEELLETFVDQFSIEFINSGIWNSICCRLVKRRSETNVSEEGRYKKKYQDFEYKKGEEFQGILRHLTKKTGGNIHDNQTINITSNSICNSYHPK